MYLFILIAAMKFEAITIKDIAKALNLSTSTVSRALRGSYEVNPETQKRVMEYAEEHHYHPNPIALGLKKRRTRAIGVIVSEIANTFFSQAINGIESIAYDQDYHVIISQSHESVERENLNLQFLSTRSVDGLLVSLSSESKDLSALKELHEKGLPMVFFDRVPEEIKTHKVKTDNFQGAYQAVEYLIQEGYTRIASLYNARHLSITTERLSGYRRAMEDHDLPIPASYIQYCEHGGQQSEEIKKAIDQMLAASPRPEVIFASGDRLTSGCLRVLKAKGLKVPEDVGLVGFSNSELMDLFDPPLTMVRQRAFEMGQIATDMLIRLIESRYPVTEFETRVLPTELMVRHSTAGAGTKRRSGSRKS